MMRTAKVLFCDNEHGSGEVSFPSELSPQDFIQPKSARQLKAEARAAGWRFYGRKGLGMYTYCPDCVACEEGRDG